MKKEIVTVVYDRKKEVVTKGFGKVEIRIYLGNKSFKYVSIHSCDPFQWKEYQNSEEMRTQLAIYRHLVEKMEKNGEELTLKNLDEHLCVNNTRTREKREIKEKKAAKMGFIDFIKEQIAKEQLKLNTMKRRYVVLEALKHYGKINSFSDLTPKNVKGFDQFLHDEDPTRTQPTIHDYHKVVKKFTRLAAQYEYIEKDPYEAPLCKFERGKSKERRPLTEEELLRIRNCKLGQKEGRVRDLFIFCAYTGLAYVVRLEYISGFIT